MNKKINFPIILLSGLFLLSPTYADHKKSHVDVEVGNLSSTASKGQLVFNTNCASCHGINAAGGGNLVTCHHKNTLPLEIWCF